MAVMNLLWEYNELPRCDEFKWKERHGLHISRLRMLNSACIYLQRRVSDFLKIPYDFIEVSSPPRSMPHGKITILRILQVWVFNQSLLQFDPNSVILEKTQSEIVVPLQPNSDRIERKNLDQIFKDRKRHPFSLIDHSCVETKGRVPLLLDDQQGYYNILESLQERLISYSTEKEVEVVVVVFKASCTFYVAATCHEKLLRELPVLDSVDLVTISAKVSTKKSRGRGERPCGTHIVTEIDSKSTTTTDGDAKFWSRIIGGIVLHTSMQTYQPSYI